jgi:poly-beta-1,6-N-acetyl-D-glucosamine synthase
LVSLNVLFTNLQSDWFYWGLFAFGLVNGVYASLLLFLAIVWLRFPTFKGRGQSLRIAVLIPFRNEEKNLPTLFSDLLRMDYPKAHFEVIFLNDHSDDQGAAWLREQIRSTSCSHFKVLDLLPNETGKKAALSKGVQAAAFDIILTTDADCRLSAHWLSTYAAFYETYNPMAVASGVSIAPVDTWLAKWQAMELAVLVGVGAVSLRLGIPTMTNGANLSYRKEAFEAVGGYSGNEHFASGDDQFLVQKIHERYPNRLFFLKSPDAWVLTQAQPNWQALVGQRRRWLSKWQAEKNRANQLIATAVWLFHLLWSLLPWVMFYQPTAMGLSLLGLRFGSEMLLIGVLLAFSGASRLLVFVPTLQTVYSLYVLYFAHQAGKTGFVWKNRAYQ